MGQNSSDKLHLEHKIWSSEIGFWKEEITFLKKILHDRNEKKGRKEIKEKISKYNNHLDHNLRFLNALEETINTHELFISEMLKNVRESDDIGIPDNEACGTVSSSVVKDENLTDHDKTGKHIKKFRKRYKKLKNKVFKIIKISVT